MDITANELQQEGDAVANEELSEEKMENVALGRAHNEVDKAIHNRTGCFMNRRLLCFIRLNLNLDKINVLVYTEDKVTEISFTRMLKT